MKKALAYAVAAALWLPALRFVLAAPDKEARAAALAAELAAPPDDLAVARLRDGNPEWDLMRRTFTVLAHANRALVEADRAAHVDAIDRLVASTLAEMDAHGPQRFLLPYWQRGATRGGRSLFVDSEIALMLGAEAFVAPERARLPALRSYLGHLEAQMSAGPLASGESYPDECWTFDNTAALAAFAIGDVVLESDHRALGARWLELARAHLLAPSGLLVSSYGWDGRVLDGPEGSSLWMSAHNLLLVDEELARDQYRRAHEALAIDVLGFGFAREWPRGEDARLDIDSGPVVPFLDASAGASGLALVGAAAFDDQAYFGALSRSLELAAFPTREGDRARYAAAGVMGNAVIGYAYAAGPLWAAVKEAR
jgi:hypothetical protein